VRRASIGQIRITPGPPGRLDRSPGNLECGQTLLEEILGEVTTDFGAREREERLRGLPVHEDHAIVEVVVFQHTQHLGIIRPAEQRAGFLVVGHEVEVLSDAAQPNTAVGTHDGLHTSDELAVFLRLDVLQAVVSDDLAKVHAICDALGTAKSVCGNHRRASRGPF